MERCRVGAVAEERTVPGLRRRPMRAMWLGLLVVAAVAIALALGRLDAERQDPASGLEAAAPVIADAAAPDSPPAGISTDACRELEPRGQEHGRTVFIDPGHGRPDPGTA